MAATHRVERIGAILTTVERDVATIERALAALKRLNIPGRH